MPDGLPGLLILLIWLCLLGMLFLVFHHVTSRAAKRPERDDIIDNDL